MTNDRLRKALLVVLALIVVVSIVSLLLNVSNGTAGGWFLQPDVKPTTRV